MEAWTAESKVLYNPKVRFIDYVIPGIIGLILQLLTVTLIACTPLARGAMRVGKLYQLMVTSLKRGEIVIGRFCHISGSTCSHRGDHTCSRLSSARAILSTAGPDRRSVVVFALFTRARTSHLRLFQDPDPSDSIFRLLFTAGLCLVRRIRPARATTPGHPIPFGSFPADSTSAGRSGW